MTQDRDRNSDRNTDRPRRGCRPAPREAPDPRRPTGGCGPRHPNAPVPKQRTPGPYRVPPRERRTGLVILNTGNGKGKTTAALGTLLRARGRDMTVAMLQFLKTEGVKRGEHIAAERIGVEIVPMGAGFTWLSERIEEDRALAHPYHTCGIGAQPGLEL